MTVCLGALCDSGMAAVVAADRMITGGDVEFEQDLQKIEKVGDGCVLLSAGSALRHIELLRRVQDSLGSRTRLSVMDVVNAAKEHYVQARRQRAEELYLKPLGMDFRYFLEQQSRIHEPLLLRLTRNLESEQLGISLLVVGVDETGAHIYYLSDPGKADCFDSIGFCGIGSGERHAELAFIRAEYSPQIPLKQALFLAYQAKRDSEMAPGVGSRYTDIGVVDRRGFRFLSEDSLAKLEELYGAFRKDREQNRARIHAQLNGLADT